MNARILPKYQQFTLYAIFYLSGTIFSSILSFNFLNSRNIFLIAISQLLILSIISLLYKNRIIFYASVSALSMFLAVFNYSFFEFRHQPDYQYNNTFTIVGKVVSKPQLDSTSQKVNLKIEKINSKVVNPDIILVKIPRYPALSYGDKISFESKIEKPGMIEDFDYGRYLRRFLIFGLVNNPSKLSFLESKYSLTDYFMRALYSVSSAFESSLNKTLPEPHASLAGGLILGLKKNIPDDFSEALKITGLTHIIALSGFNITIIVSLFESLLSGVFNRKRIFWASLLFVLFFVVMTGASSSVIRAAIFSMLIIFGKTIGRKGNFTNILLLAAILMIIQNPFALRDDVGFQLSFLAFSGIIYISPLIKKVFENKKLQNTPQWLSSSLSETFGAQITVLPILIVTFGRVSIISPLANILIVWIIAPAMFLVFLTGLLGLILYPLAKIIAVFAWLPLSYIIKITVLLSKIPGASFEFGQGIWVLFILLYLFIVLTLMHLYRKLKLNVI